MPTLRDLAVASASAIAVTAVVLLIVVLPAVMWGSDRSQEFFGAFFGSLVSALAAVVAVVVSARQGASAEREKEVRARREQLTSLAQLAHSELIGSALAIERFGKSLAALRERGASANDFLALMETWRTLAVTPTVDKWAFEILRLGPMPAAALSKSLHARSNFVALLEVWEDKAKRGMTLSADHVTALHRLCVPLPLTFFAAAHQIREHASKDAAWLDLDGDTIKKVADDWREFRRKLGLEVDAGQGETPTTLQR